MAFTVMDTESGHATETLYGAYKVDHVLLSPNAFGKRNKKGSFVYLDDTSNDPEPPVKISRAAGNRLASATNSVIRSAPSVRAGCPR